MSHICNEKEKERYKIVIKHYGREIEYETAAYSEDQARLQVRRKHNKVHGMQLNQYVTIVRIKKELKPASPDNKSSSSNLSQLFDDSLPLE